MSNEVTKYKKMFEEKCRENKEILGKYEQILKEYYRVLDEYGEKPQISTTINRSNSKNNMFTSFDNTKTDKRKEIGRALKDVFNHEDEQEL